MRRVSNLPIQIRLTLIFTGLFMLLLLVIGLGLYFVVLRTLDHRLEQDMYDEADSLLSSAHYPDGTIRLPGKLVSSGNENNLNPVIIPQIQVDMENLSSSVIIYRPDVTLLADGSSGLLNTAAVAELAKSVKGFGDGQGRYQRLRLAIPDQRNQSQQFMLYARPFYGLAEPENAQSPLQVVALFVGSRSYEETATLLDTMSRLLLISLPIALLMSLLIGNLVAGRALRPIGLMTATARQIGATDLSRRIGLKSRDELGELSQTFDEMIERLQNSFGRQRRFLADASHELRTPLAVIEAEATLMLRRPRDQEDYRQALELVATEAERMRRLLDDMLLLARADSGELAVHSERLVLEELVEEAVAHIRRLAEQRQQELKYENEAAENRHWLVGDPQLLLGLFYNLLSNAVKYTPTGGKITVSIEENSLQEVKVKVQDNGPGIAPEHLPYLFDRFYRVDQARTSSGSSGLGLAIAQWTAHLQGGRIEVESELGKGSLFTVILPPDVK